MLVFPYIRVSTQEQAKEGVSIGTQKKRLTDFYNSQGWELYDFYIDDGISAKDMKRDELQRMMHDIKTVDHKNKVVLVLKLDRLTRSVRDLYDMLQEFEQHHTAFRSATEVFDTTTAMGRLFITIVAAMAQWERENTSERIAMNMEQIVMEGRWHGSTPSFGYDYENKELVINEEEARIVKMIFNKYIGGYGDARLARWLNRQGYRTKKGEQWGPGSVAYILKNPIFIGKLRWNYQSEGEYIEISGFVPKIIDDETFDTVQKLRKERASMHPRAVNSIYPFSGKIRCGRCGSPMKVTKSPSHLPHRVYIYYECIEKSKGLCNLPKIRMDKIEKRFLEKIRAYQDSQTALEVASSEDNGDNKSEIKYLYAEIDKVKKRREKWQHAYADEVISIDDLRERMAEEAGRENELREQLEALTLDDVKEKPTAEEIAAILEDFDSQWEDATAMEKKTMVQLLTKSIIVDSPHDNFSRVKHKDRKVDVTIEFK